MVTTALITLIAILSNYLLRSIKLSFYLETMHQGDSYFHRLTFSGGWVACDRVGDYFTALAPYAISAYLLFIVCYFANPADHLTEH